MGAKCENNMLIGEVGHVWQKEIADGSLIELQRLTGVCVYLCVCVHVCVRAHICKYMNALAKS